uniref:Uncharacterized protein n=1 Tax=Escherichia coli TaxID=562 RepID=A0A8F1IFB5_ECOLX|nr:hypothetical protein IHCLGBEB_00018 [Escherichia coli]
MICERQNQGGHAAFFRRCYTAEKLEKDYLAEVANYSNDRWEAPQRASRLAVYVKRVTRHQKCCALFLLPLPTIPIQI